MEMEAKVKFGSSLLVPCVQELAKENQVTIPERYIRPDQVESLLHKPTNTHGIPVIDMHMLLSPESVHSNSELAILHSASKEWGFFQLVNHGVSSALMEKVKKSVQDFFNLPMEEKQKFWQRPGEVEGFGQAFVVSEEQKLDWGDIFFLTTYPVHERKPHLFPKLPLPFRENLDAYSTELHGLAMTILLLMGKALNIGEEEMREYFEGGFQSMRMNYYPPCPQPEKVIGLTPHSDAVALTLLLQLNEVGGLQIRKDGEWIPVKPLPDAFIVNIGDILEIISNGIYRSIEHRATVNSEKERLSVAAFFSPRFSGYVGPASSLVTDHTPALFKTVTTEEYFKGLFARELGGKSYLDAMRI
ncbi:Protein srg1 [Turnera subulata]|uniref:Protein srg1 n=1 Tax=Turnera subulata TaxID=218843 RepID=A0A9Q0FFP3_9ROSI|nr:Protein srg1 [Turnera subulata]